MPINELQRLVLLEAGCLVLICTIIIAAFRRAKIILAVAITLASAAFFTAWSFAMAMGAFLVYVPATTLLLMQSENKSTQPAHLKHIPALAWAVLAIGVITLIVKNVCNILEYLSH